MSPMLLLIFYLDILYINESGALKFPSMIVKLFISPLVSVPFCFTFLGAVLLL